MLDQDRTVKAAVAQQGDQSTPRDFAPTSDSKAQRRLRTVSDPSSPDRVCASEFYILGVHHGWYATEILYEAKRIVADRRQIRGIHTDLDTLSDIAEPSKEVLG